MRGHLQTIVAWLGVLAVVFMLLGFCVAPDLNLDLDVVWLSVGVYLGIVLFFLPSLIADARNHQNLNSICLLNLLLGWSLLGWIVALIWSFTNRES